MLEWGLDEPERVSTAEGVALPFSNASLWLCSLPDDVCSSISCAVGSEAASSSSFSELLLLLLLVVVRSSGESNEEGRSGSVVDRKLVPLIDDVGVAISVVRSEVSCHSSEP